MSRDERIRKAPAAGTSILLLLTLVTWAGVARTAVSAAPESPPSAPPAETFSGAPVPSAPVVIGSKQFTESVVLGEIAADLLHAAGFPTDHKRGLGGTRVLYDALARGDIDLYPEYSGTIREEILKNEHVSSDEEAAAILARRGIRMSAPLGFNDTYALGMPGAEAARLRIRRISDLRQHPDLRFGFSNEFMDRADGWPGLRRAYRLPQADVRGLDHDLAYRALQAGSIDLTDVYSTDAEIPYYHLLVLDDDQQYFPRYDALFLYRTDLARRAPEAVAALQSLAGRIPEEEIRGMNERVKIGREPESKVAADFLSASGLLEGHRPAVQEESVLGRIWRRTREHLFLVAVSMAGGILVALPLGILAAKRPGPGRLILGTVGVIQTIPALALLVLMIPLLGIAAPPSIAALFLYSLLPMVRNTQTGLQAIPLPLEESADVLGLSPWRKLWSVELPLASRSILAGIKTSAVITVGFATLGALIGAGGYGQPILTGIRLDDHRLILEGAVPAALLALAVQLAFDLAERVVLPRGLRLTRST